MPSVPRPALPTTSHSTGSSTCRWTQFNTPWFRYFLTYEPATVIEQVTVPVLAINGEKDLQVPYEENLREIEAACSEAATPTTRSTRFPT